MAGLDCGSDGGRLVGSRHATLEIAEAVLRGCEPLRAGAASMRAPTEFLRLIDRLVATRLCRDVEADF